MSARWRICSLLLLICTLEILHLADGGAVFYLKMISYKNPSEKDWDGSCCEIFCVGACDHRFTVCLDEKDGNGDANDCTVKHFQTSEYLDKNDVYFDHDLNGGHYNPIKIEMTEWPGALKLKVEVKDDDTGHSGHDLVDKLYHVYADIPARSLNNATWKELLVKGTRKKADVTSLTVAFLLYCEADFYGRDCKTYCKAQNNAQGHYTCNPETGGKICLPEYEAPEANCTIIKDDCRDANCQNGGTCIDGDRSYNCSCPAGFTGAHCENNTDECQSDPCQNGGVCMDGVDGYSCVCPSGLAGDLCEYHVCSNKSTQVHCQNGGTCYGDGQCLCLQGFAGPQCEIDKCLYNFVNCYNDGKCWNGQCNCTAGFIGHSCDVDLCQLHSCDNGGTCVQGVCNCMTGFTGRYCQTNINDCTSLPCQYDGTCYDDIDGYFCRCLPNYRGLNCEQYIPPSVTLELEDSNRVGIQDDSAGSPGVEAVSGANTLPGFMIYVIIGMALLLLIIVVLIALLMKHRQRKRADARQQEQLASVHESMGGTGTGMRNFDNPLYLNEANGGHPGAVENPYADVEFRQGAMAAGISPVTNVKMPREFKPPPYSPTDIGASAGASVYDVPPSRQENAYDVPPPLPVKTRPRFDDDDSEGVCTFDMKYDAKN